MNRTYVIFATVAALTLLVAGPSHAFPDPGPVDLGTAGQFAILAKSGISTSGGSVVGDIGVSPIDDTAITGFGLTMDGSGTFSTSALVTGRVYAANYTEPTPTNMTTAVDDMLTAYTDAAGRAPDVTELGGGTLAGYTLDRGVYKWTTPVTITTDLTLSGGADDVWIFQIAGTLNISDAKKVILSGGAQADNVFWQVTEGTALGTTSEFAGTILDYASIVINTGATLDGRALSQTAVTLNGSVIPEPCTILLLGSGLVGLLASRRRSRSAA